MKNSYANTPGFTIVELLIVIVVIGILATIASVAYTGISAKARDSVRQQDIRQVQKLIELYYAQNGEYPKTADSITVQSATTVRTDANCTVGTKQADWVPGLDVKLPQSRSNNGKGRSGQVGCYMYASDGQKYVISAWNNIESGPQTATMYRRLGFREIGFANTSNAYFCNQNGVIGGISSGVYSATLDYYKYSYTLSNITDCNETPPSGA
jgi:prepilin-type N-terminal cleavage/methylation domain-containing protein